MLSFSTEEKRKLEDGERVEEGERVREWSRSQEEEERTGLFERTGRRTRGFPEPPALERVWTITGMFERRAALMPKAYSRRSWWSGSSGSSNGPSLSQHLNRMSTQACPVWESRIYGRRARLNRPSASPCSRLIIDRDPAPLMDGQFTRRFTQSRTQSFLRAIDLTEVGF